MRPYNGMQRTALRAAADAERQAIGTCFAPVEFRHSTSTNRRHSNPNGGHHGSLDI